MALTHCLKWCPQCRSHVPVPNGPCAALTATGCKPDLSCVEQQCLKCLGGGDMSCVWSCGGHQLQGTSQPKPELCTAQGIFSRPPRS